MGVLEGWLAVLVEGWLAVLVEGWRWNVEQLHRRCWGTISGLAGAQRVAGGTLPPCKHHSSGWRGASTAEIVSLALRTGTAL